MARINGIGPVSLGGVSLTNFASYDVNLEAPLEEVEDMQAPFAKRVVKAGGWKASVKFELPVIGRALTGGISIGNWNGVEVREYSFTAECKMEECTGQADLWQVFNPTRGDASFTAEKWEATDSYDVFQALLIAQATSLAAVAVSSPFGSFNGLVNKSDFTGEAKPASEKIEVQVSDGELVAGSSGQTQIDTLIGYIIAQCAATVSAGYTDPLALVTPKGRGNCYVAKVDMKAPEGKVTGSLDLQGTGAWA